MLINTRTMSFKTNFYPYCLSEWKKLDADIGSSPSISIFKTKLLKCIRPAPNLIYSINNPEGLAILTQLLAGLSKLNFHKFRDNIKDAVNPMFPVNDGARI